LLLATTNGTGVHFYKDCTLSGSSTDTWIFQIAGDIIRSSNMVFLARKTTYGANFHFEGVILCTTSAPFVTGSSINGSVLMQTGATLQQTTITHPRDFRMSLRP